MNDDEPAAPLGGGGLASSLRIRLDFGYDGTAFSGWAMQPGKRTVEDELSAALTLILRVPGSTACCPRTSSCTLSRWHQRVSTPVSRPSSAATSIGSVTTRNALIRYAAMTR